MSSERKYRSILSHSRPLLSSVSRFSTSALVLSSTSWMSGFVEQEQMSIAPRMKTKNLFILLLIDNSVDILSKFRVCIVLDPEVFALVSVTILGCDYPVNNEQIVFLEF